MFRATSIISRLILCHSLVVSWEDLVVYTCRDKHNLFYFYCIFCLLFVRKDGRLCPCLLLSLLIPLNILVLFLLLYIQ